MKLFILFIATVLSASAHGQFIERKLRAQFSYGTISLMGNATYADGSFTMPSFYPGFTTATGMEARLSYTLYKRISIATGINSITMSSWKMGGESVYANSECSAVMINPLILFHTPFRNDNRLSNRGRVYVGAGMTFGTTRISGIAADYSNTSVEELLDAEGPLSGIRIVTGAEYSLTELLAIFGEASFTGARTKVYLVPDKTLAFLQFSGGLSFKFRRNKNYSLY